MISLYQKGIITKSANKMTPKLPLVLLIVLFSEYSGKKQIVLLK